MKCFYSVVLERFAIDGSAFQSVTENVIYSFTALCRIRSGEQYHKEEPVANSPFYPDLERKIQPRVEVLVSGFLLNSVYHGV